MKKFSTLILLLLLSATLILAQDRDSKETLIEQAKALAAEQSTGFQPVVQIPLATTSVTHPLFVGVDDPAIPALQMDPTNGDTMSAFVGFDVYGAAYDNINNKVYFNDGATLYEWEVGGNVTQLGTIVDTSGATFTLVGLAWYNGVLYGCRNIANEAVYEVDLNTLTATVYIDYVDADFDYGGLAFDPTTGELYGTNDDSTPNARGLYIINTDGTGTLVVPYPGSETDIDGLAISDSRVAYFIIDQPGEFYVYDLAGGTFLPSLTSPWPSSEVFSGGTWNGGVIPVELATFSASVSGNTVNLQWKTATEVNNSGFSIERKSEGSEYKEVGFVPGFGSTTEPKSYAYTDADLGNGIYTYRLKQIDYNGTYEYSNAVEVTVNIPSSFSLEQNFPNPFNPTTNISYSIPEAGNLKLSVFNLLGEEVALLVSGYSEAGQFEVKFDASDLPSGIYFYRLTLNDTYSSMKKLVLLK